MSGIYLPIYANLYDDIYQTPDYKLPLLQDGLSIAPPSHILDLGCGTGRHASLLIDAGYRVCGVDSSAKMLERAQNRFPAHSWINQTVENFEIDVQFRGAIMLGDIISYHLTNSSIIKAFRNIRKHLRLGTKLLFDAWYGPAVLSSKPTTSVVKTSEFTREAKGTLNTIDNTCIVEYKFSFNRAKPHFEMHHLRYFFVPEIKQFLETTGFCLLEVGTRAGLSRAPTDGDWHVLFSASTV